MKRGYVIKKCKVEGCIRDVKAKGLCDPHYLQMRRTGRVKKLRNEDRISERPKCKHLTCEELHFAKGYCRRHYNHVYHCGHVKDRTIFDDNKMIIDSDICRIELYNQKNQKVAESLIDIEDVKKCKNSKWYLGCGDKYGRFRYVMSKKGKKYIKLSRLIMDAKKGQVVDHINHDTLDNRKNNLRLCTHAQNCQNKLFASNNISGFKNVYWRKDIKKWLVSITVDGLQIHIGNFIDMELAKKAAQAARQRYHKTFACND